ncbi:MAG: porin [Alphaproteobacteria bacterium]|nr:porin [Alphaproteobacteria bacterium]
MDYGTYGTAGFFGDESEENINKISYYTPRFSGFQAGVSYVFSNVAGNTGTGVVRTDTAGQENILLGAVNYEGKFSDVGVKLGATGEHGKSTTTAEDLRTWQVGGQVDYMGFSVAASYADLGDSYRAANSGLDDNNFWTVGAAYETGPFGVSVTYLKSNYEVSTTTDTEFTNLSFGADYKLAPGLTPYAEVSLVEVDGPGTGTANDNEGTVFLVGSALSF